MLLADQEDDIGAQHRQDRQGPKHNQQIAGRASADTNINLKARTRGRRIILSSVAAIISARAECGQIQRA